MSLSHSLFSLFFVLVLFSLQVQSQTCSYISDSIKIAKGDSALVEVTGGCDMWPVDYMMSVTVSSNNPTGDDEYFVAAYFWPGASVTSKGCTFSGQMCDYNMCIPTPYTPDQHYAAFNFTSCGNNAVPLIQFGCSDTRGITNHHCEVDYKIANCGVTYVGQNFTRQNECYY